MTDQEKPADPSPAAETHPAAHPEAHPTEGMSTDDLRDELARREEDKAHRRHARGWKTTIAGAVAAALVAWYPSITKLIEAKAEKTHQEVLADEMARESLASQAGYEELAKAVNKQSADIAELQALKSLVVDLAVLKEWRRNVDEKLHQRFAIQVPEPAPAPPEEAARMLSLPAPKEEARVSAERPEPTDEGAVQQLKQELKVKGAY